MRAVKFPSQGTVFDYFIDPESKKFTPWNEKMVPFELEPDVPLQVCQSSLIPTLLIVYLQKKCLWFFSDCVGPHTGDHLSDLLHGPAAAARQTHHVGGQCRRGQNDPGV